MAKAAGPQFPTRYKHRFGNQYVEVHLNGSTMYIFGAGLTPSGKRGVYYDEWVGMEFQGWQQRNFDGASRAVAATGWGETLQETVPGKNFTTTLLMSDGTVMKLLFYLEHPQAEKGVKFSFEMLKPSSFNYDDGFTKMALAMNPIIRQEVIGARPLACTGATNILDRFSCSSDIANLTISPALAASCAAGTVTFASRRLSISVTVQTCYSIDNEPTVRALSDLDLSPFLPGIGSLRAFSRRYNLDSSTKYENISGTDQYVVLPFSAGYNKFHNISWDPDVTISLLFTLPDDEIAPSLGDLDKSTGQTTIILAVVLSLVGVAAIVALVVLTDLKYKWIPFLRSREAAAEAEPAPIEEEFAPPSSDMENRRWSKGAQARASLTNV